jgi:uncharacterized Zn-finger protein
VQGSFNEQSSSQALAAFNFQGYDDFFSTPDHSAFYQAQQDYLPALPDGKYPQDMIMITPATQQNYNPNAIVSTRMPVKAKKPKKVKEETSGSGPMTLPCPEPGCEKVFNRQFNLKSHLKSHATERNFICDMCPASFRRYISSCMFILVGVMT